MKKLFVLLWIWVYSLLWFNCFASLSSLPDFFQVEVIPNKFSVDDKVDLKVTAIKNGEVFQDYDWYFDIFIKDSNDYYLSDDALIPDGWWWHISYENKGIRLYKKWMGLRNPGEYRVGVMDFTDELVAWETFITVLPSSNESSDVVSNQSEDEMILFLNEKWITIHNNWNNFKPNQTLRRDEAAKMLSIAYKYLSNKADLSNTFFSCSFWDLDKARSDLKEIIVESCRLWLFKWSNNIFNPQNTITNAQVLTVIGRMLYGMQNEWWDHYAKNYIDKLTNAWYLSDMNLSRSNWDIPASRWDIAKLLRKILQ